MALEATVAAGDGSVTVPGMPGDDVLELFPTWETACFRGEGVTYAVIRVH